ncbi:hypothetical protein C4K38_2116 [Pseudomonas chlororaphis subsp. piscium]|uniref:hypothetical protein n=1 Tax=Pseudomonas chlororaphis TaxID=587753 RepID=UPI0006A60155|nr:hypothetical protein [Pseudomonas chlororaphis]AZC30076.1 hypothetical protein C4K38_2116 [Pseudomonas chlororaphis subsp. piscium]WDG94006.1 hypothetical protein PUP49_11470 [Pseudomonas chlororaphis]SDT25452.1 hypothetical protein SAMN05216585_5261 [Pseudomonas chlororaphis]
MPEENEIQNWDGEGLPPVGTLCESRRPNTNLVWRPATILCLGEKRAFFRDGEGNELSRSFEEVEFRPARTPEQIAAEERRSAIDTLADELAGYQGCEAKDRHQNLALYLHDQDYRKQVAP